MVVSFRVPCEWGFHRQLTPDFSDGGGLQRSGHYLSPHKAGSSVGLGHVCFQNKRASINKDELKSTSKAVETVHNLCCNENKGASELVAELSTLYQCIR